MERMKYSEPETSASSLRLGFWASADLNNKFALAKIYRRTLFKLLFGICLIFGSVGLCWSARGARITTFDIPGAVSITPLSINSAGEITGWYQDLTGPHG